MRSEDRLRLTQELHLRLVDFWHDVDTNWGRNAADFYTEDGVFEASETTYSGREHIRKFYAYRLSRGARVAVHSVTNFRAEFVTADQAVSTWYLLLHAQDGEPVLPSAPPIQIALATDTSLRGPDGIWRYRHRKFETWFKGGVPTTTFRG
ncbi:nuclear transport factor 2 family protein [Xinfangfangia pollutisoli]|uniref:nuclear transport factor 2 family protein n=1 Tax=Xinfangfangia pollutisoli TaxID=2865960 RepID=UPI001CD20DE5|nr:nuclear transport factor 2 family protein [Xinfangfangia pollutisoli]